MRLKKQSTAKKHEETARHKYIESSQSEVFVPGLIVNKIYPWLAYSADGVVFRNGKPFKLLEIKCPYAGNHKYCLLDIMFES